MKIIALCFYFHFTPFAMCITLKQQLMKQMAFLLHGTTAPPCNPRTLPLIINTVIDLQAQFQPQMSDKLQDLRLTMLAKSI